MQRVIAVWQQLAATTILVIAALSLCATTPMVRTADCGAHDCHHKYTFAAIRPSGAGNSVANQMGMPSAAGGETWIMGGQLNPGSPVITRPAPAIPPNAGGAIEAVTQPGGVSINWFHMP